MWNTHREIRCTRTLLLNCTLDLAGDFFDTWYRVSRLRMSENSDKDKKYTSFKLAFNESS